jgi:hypothetical protein
MLGVEWDVFAGARRGPDQRATAADRCDIEDRDASWEKWERGRSDGIGLAIQAIEKVMAARKISAQQEEVLLEVYDSLWEAKDVLRQRISACATGGSDGR